MNADAGENWGNGLFGGFGEFGWLGRAFAYFHNVNDLGVVMRVIGCGGLPPSKAYQLGAVFVISVF